MDFLRNMSIGRKLTAIIMTISALTLLLACLVMGIYEVITFRRTMAQELATLADVVAGNSTAALTFRDPQAAQDVLLALRAEPHVTVARIYSQDGKPFATYTRDVNRLHLAPPFPQKYGTYFERDHVAEFRPIALAGDTIGVVYIESDLEEMYARLRRFASVIVLVVVASSVLALLLASRFQKLISQPVLELLQTAKTVSSAKNYALRCPVTSHDEIGSLVAGFNEMLAQIEHRDHELELQRADLQKEVVARTAMNAQLEAAKEIAEAASQAKGEFLANMSHEIRTPINGIMGMTELALDTELTQEQRDYLLMVKSSGESLLSVINDILDFSKVESGKLDLEKIEFNLYNCVGEVMKALALRAHEKGLELAYDVHPDVTAEVSGDPGRLRQILVNLVGNAIKFTETGEVLVEVENRSSADGLVELHFKVTDTGVGIPADKHDLLFQPFTQADSSTTRKYGGTGLGLAISTRLVSLMDGKIWLESEEGKGSTFHFTAQFGRAAAKADAPRLLETDLAGVPVLVVDDNETNRRILERMTSGWGMRPSVVESGPAALVAIEAAHRRGQSFRAILVDVCMPGMDGFQLAEKIQHHSILAKATILMLTSAGHPGEAARCRRLGISAYLLKPVLKADLQNAILTVLGRSSGAAPVIPLVTRHTLREVKRKFHILVAEDNSVNQILIVRVLEKMGHTSVVVGNGKEALARVSSEQFDLVFMDVQMPEMDGLAATAAIRKTEEAKGTHIPIFAMTAHAMKGDRERCLQAGMDGYIAKPVRLSDIEHTLATLAEGKRTQPIPQPVLWGRQEALERLGGDENLLQDLCHIFLEESPKLLQKLRQALANGEPGEVMRTAHSLKGELLYLGVPEASQAARQLEDMGHEKDLARAGEVLARLEREVAGLHSTLKNSAGVIR
jgi:two-component system sensor histidine kinase/response regulator